jgi:hypothetical protein
MYSLVMAPGGVALRQRLRLGRPVQPILLATCRRIPASKTMNQNPPPKIRTNRAGRPNLDWGSKPLFTNQPNAASMNIPTNKHDDLRHSPTAFLRPCSISSLPMVRIGTWQFVNIRIPKLELPETKARWCLQSATTHAIPRGRRSLPPEPNQPDLSDSVAASPVVIAESNLDTGAACSTKPPYCEARRRRMDI